jgi:hypothetical protein
MLIVAVISECPQRAIMCTRRVIIGVCGGTVAIDDH